jgi:hypothetical protein
MKKAAVIVLILGLAVSGVCWWGFYHAKAPQPARVAEYESDMMEGLLRGIFRQLDESNLAVYFLAFGEARTEPSGAFIARFADHHPPVRRFTSSVVAPGGMVFETSTGRPGVIIQVISFKESSAGTFDVLVAFSNRPAGRDRVLYRISNDGGEWLIKNWKTV